MFLRTTVEPQQCRLEERIAGFRTLYTEILHARLEAGSGYKDYGLNFERASLPYTAGLQWYWARTRDKASHDPMPIPLGYRGHVKKDGENSQRNRSLEYPADIAAVGQLNLIILTEVQSRGVGLARKTVRKMYGISGFEFTPSRKTLTPSVWARKLSIVPATSDEYTATSAELGNIHTALLAAKERMNLPLFRLPMSIRALHTLIKKVEKQRAHLTPVDSTPKETVPSDTPLDSPSKRTLRNLRLKTDKKKTD
ncbi:hypothetical protein TNCV_2558781 [Trichonephila clavipes]|nr:hypothetical protein TNCV_2558781 [Trichonephila clavipes]